MLGQHNCALWLWSWLISGLREELLNMQMVLWAKKYTANIRGENAILDTRSPDCRKKLRDFSIYWADQYPLNWIHKLPRENPSCYTTLSLFAFFGFFAVSQICHGYWLKSQNDPKIPAPDPQRIFLKLFSIFSMRKEPAQQLPELHFLLIDITWSERGQCRVDKFILSLTWAPSSFLLSLSSIYVLITLLHPLPQSGNSLWKPHPQHIFYWWPLLTQFPIV